MDGHRKRTRTQVAQIDGFALIGQRRLSYDICSSILKATADVHVSARDVRTAGDNAVRDTFSEVGMELKLPLSSGGELCWKLASPQKLLAFHLRRSEFLQRRFKGNVQAPWSLVLYHDEVTPGNLKAPDNQRKFFAFRFSFKELGYSFLERFARLNFQKAARNIQA